MSENNRRPTGARPSPRHKAFGAHPHIAKPVPARFGVIPPRLDIWGNDVHGDCVSAEEAAAKAQWSLMLGGNELFITRETVVEWAKQHGFLEGADLTSVMETMTKEGMAGEDGIVYTDGPYQTVDWTNDAVLSSAIYQGPVKIGVASEQLQQAVTESNGWIATGFKHDGNTDHCVNLCGFGTLGELCSLVNVSVPSGHDASARCYLLFTWGTIGIIDRQSMLNITEEAWLRVPTTSQTPGPQPGPAPAPTPAPTPGPVPQLIQFLMQLLQELLGEALRQDSAITPAEIVEMILAVLTALKPLLGGRRRS